SAVLPLDNFRISGNELVFDDLALNHGFSPEPQYQFRWFLFDNQTGARTPVSGATLPQLPSNAAILSVGSYVAAEIRASNVSDKSLTDYLRKTAETWYPVGIDRQ